MATWVIFSAGKSRGTALNLDKARYFLEAVPTWIAADSVFPAWYADTFRDRWRFGTCRLVLKEHPLDREFILAMALLGGRMCSNKKNDDAARKICSRDDLGFVVVSASADCAHRPIADHGVLRITRVTFGRRFKQSPRPTASALSVDG